MRGKAGSIFSIYIRGGKLAFAFSVSKQEKGSAVRVGVVDYTVALGQKEGIRFVNGFHAYGNVFCNYFVCISFQANIHIVVYGSFANAGDAIAINIIAQRIIDNSFFMLYTPFRLKRHQFCSRFG